MNLPYSILLLICLTGCSRRDAQSDAFVGKFSGENVSLALGPPQEGKLKGVIRLRGESYRAVARLNGDRLTGKFKVADEFYDFVLRREGDRLLLESGGKKYRLRRQGENPLSLGAKGDSVAATNEISAERQADYAVSSRGTKASQTPRAAGTPSPDKRAAGTPSPDNRAAGTPSPDKRAAGTPSPDKRAAGEASATATAAGKPGTGDGVGSKQAVEPKVAAKRAGFQGRFTGLVSGTPTEIRLQDDGASVSGIIDASGYTYRLEGSSSGRRSSGTLLDGTTGGRIPYTATLDGGTLHLEFGGVVVSFQRGGAGGSVAGKGATTRGKEVGVAGERNTALVGLWTRTDSLSSGGASMSTQYFLRVHANGAFETGIGRSAGGGAGWSVGGGGMEVQARGRWKSVGNIVHVSEGGAFQAYARYTVESGKLMFTFANGTREIWYRN